MCRRGIKEYEPARFMTVNQCVEQLLEVENERKEGGQPPHETAPPIQHVGVSSVIAALC